MIEFFSFADRRTEPGGNIPPGDRVRYLEDERELDDVLQGLAELTHSRAASMIAVWRSDGDDRWSYSVITGRRGAPDWSWLDREDDAAIS